ncbi:MAG: type IV secretory system conjugative DNA transfer family protein, partial [Chlorobiales bacterium]|nr:type IV secretory system conjugative DNA transfer family protein [Chlorobiales bacterium]
MQPVEERLGSFYLGAEYDLETGKRLDEPLNYDARDLTTHAVCVGMTGSGKTGLCIGLLEEAALDRVPLIIVDPKGDMTNLLLQCPDLLPENFLPWINEEDARRKGMNPEDLAAKTAETWKNGLSDWGISTERIRQLHDSGQFTIYTPGSDTGIPVSIMGSLASPGLDFEEHTETIRERIAGTVNALLGLAGLQVDPVRSRESILLASIFEHFWKSGQDLDLALLINSIQKPPMRQLGVFDVNTFFPEKDRFELAMALNAIIASPSFQSWLAGEPLDIDRMLFTPEGKPRQSIFYLAHLSDSERMFFVT